MLEFLLIIILILVIIIFTTLNSKFKNLESLLFKMSDRIHELKKELESKSFDKIVEKPIEEPIKPIESPKPIEKFEPIIEEKPIVEEIIEEVKEKPIEVVETISTPKLEQKPKPVYIPQKTWYEKFKENNPDLEKFVGENLINKIGILILVLGISFFVKYAIDKDWINEPARVGIGILEK